LGCTLKGVAIHFFIIVDQYYKVKSLRLIVTPCETTILPVMIPAEARKQQGM